MSYYCSKYEFLGPDSAGVRVVRLRFTARLHAQGPSRPLRRVVRIDLRMHFVHTRGRVVQIFEGLWDGKRAGGG